ncbi:hypothetical protein Bbelb_154480 [Branchiostoma belcheri]|nr:hypothetical protein Bbelb_154480 [Branchiostoma belcheri]
MGNPCRTPKEPDSESNPGVASPARGKTTSPTPICFLFVDWQPSQNAPGGEFTDFVIKTGSSGTPEGHYGPPNLRYPFQRINKPQTPLPDSLRSNKHTVPQNPLPDSLTSKLTVAMRGEPRTPPESGGVRARK